MTEGIYLLLGSNMGDKRQQLTTAIDKISIENKIITKSAIYETSAWGNTNQPSFYNQVIRINTSLNPQELLAHLLSIELQMGRIRKEKWGQRVIDIDIIYYNDQIISSHQLSIPHPEIQNRKFTLIPLVEIAPRFEHPLLKKNQKELLGLCKDTLEVTLRENE